MSMLKKPSHFLQQMLQLIFDKLLRRAMLQVGVFIVTVAALISMVLVAAIDWLWDGRFNTEMEFAGVLVPCLIGLLALSLLVKLLNDLREKVEQRKVAEDQIRQQHELTTQIIETIPLRVFWKDCDSRYLGCNTLFAQDAGLTRPDELIGKTDFDMGWRDQAELYRADDRQVMDSNRPKLSYDKPQTTPEGGRIWLRTSKVPLHHEVTGISGMLGVYEDITAYKQLELKLRESEERFRKAFQNSAIGMALVGLDGRWIKVNSSLCQIVGYPEQELLAKTFQDITHPDDLQVDLDFVVQLLAGEIDHFQMEKRYFHKDGHVVWIRLSVSLIRDAQNDPLHFVAQIEDITEDKQAAESLRKANVELGLFRSLLDKSNDAIEVIAPVSLRILDVNEKACFDLGYSREELLSMSIYDIDPSYTANTNNMIEEQIQRTGNARFEGIHRRRDGSTFPVEISSGLVNLDKPYVLSIVRDITERKQAEQALEESERKFRAILETTVDGILVADGETHKFVLGNRAICDMLGYKRHELAQLGVADIHPAEALSEVQRQFERQLSGEIKVAANLPIKRKDGSIFFADVSSSPMELLGHPFLVGIFHDVSERMQAEENVLKLNEELEARVRERTQQLLAAQEELVRREKLAVLGQVAGSVGHELRNPLGVMNNAVYFLQTVLADADDTTQEYLNIIKDEIAGSERIVADLLDSVRTKPPNPEIVRVAELINRTLRKYNVPTAVTVQLDLPAMLPALRVDAMQIQQVLRNLISNGVEAMPDGGTLQIGAIENAQAQTVTISVTDSGIGMTPEQLSHLFQPLFTTKARGIGLGLVVVKNLTQANGGSIEVHSDVGKGTTFAITLPAVNAKLS